MFADDVGLLPDHMFTRMLRNARPAPERAVELAGPVRGAPRGVRELALDVDVLLQRHEDDAGLGEGVEDGDNLTQRPTEPGEFADDQAVAALEDAHQLVEPAALLGSLSGVFTIHDLPVVCTRECI